jgi:C4-dicarboxylate transporter DctM subunit
MAAVGACAAFGSVCGSSVATAATIGSVALPEMRRHGYSGRLATATLAAGGTLGILIPPSVVLVVYAILTEQNIAKLFAAAFIPGMLAMIGYMIAIAIYVRVVPGQAPESDVVRAPSCGASAVGVWPVAAIFLMVFGGIYGGVFTPTEGASIGAASPPFSRRWCARARSRGSSSSAFMRPLRRQR